MKNEIINPEIKNKEESLQYMDEQKIDRNIDNKIEINKNNSFFLEKVKNIQKLIKKEFSYKKMCK